MWQNVIPDTHIVNCQLISISGNPQRWSLSSWIQSCCQQRSHLDPVSEGEILIFRDNFRSGFELVCYHFNSLDYKLEPTHLWTLSHLNFETPFSGITPFLMQILKSNNYPPPPPLPQPLQNSGRRENDNSASQQLPSFWILLLIHVGLHPKLFKHSNEAQLC